MSRNGPQRTSVSALMGASILDAGGRAFGRVKEFAVSPQVDASRVQALVVKRNGVGQVLVSINGLRRSPEGELQMIAGVEASPMPEKEEYLLLERDLLDQQIIDVHGHKVVRVNDVDMIWNVEGEEELVLRIAEVEVGIRGALRRLLKGLPVATVERLACRIRPSVIPWDFVDLIDRDPARRVRLKIEQDRLLKMHPSDLADILEELAPAERQALFSSLDEEVAAEALEEVGLKTQKNLIESLDSEVVAGIIGEMDPGAAADLLSELSHERSDAILEEMDEKERHDVEELLEYSPDSAAGLMTTEFVALPSTATVEETMSAMSAFEGDLESVTNVFVLDGEGCFEGVVPVSRLLLASRDAVLGQMHEGHMVSSALTANGRKVAELFDKYNLRSLPVLDAKHRLAGVIHAEHVIAWLRHSH